MKHPHFQCRSVRAGNTGFRGRGRRQPRTLSFRKKAPQSKVLTSEILRMVDPFPRSPPLGLGRFRSGCFAIPRDTGK